MASEQAPGTRHVVVMGVSGCGKTTVASGLAEGLAWHFGEADRFHPPANIDKMAAGSPLTDEDRWPWLRDLAAWMAVSAGEGVSTVIACSALRRVYRDILRDGPPEVEFIHLSGPMDVIAERMRARSGHFMPTSLLQSQFDTLEDLEDDEVGIVLDLRRTPEQLISDAQAWVQREHPSGHR